MTYRDDFENSVGWSAVDTNRKLNNALGKEFLSEMRANGVEVVIRYYAAIARPKTLTPEEAKFISAEGFAILPVYQDNNRRIENFTTALGEAAAANALAFAKRIGQPKGSTIMFAVDNDFSAAEIDGPILDYFRAIKDAIHGSYKIGAYGNGALLAKLQAEGIITIPWISMSRGHLGTQSFFYGKKWAMRQIPPEKKWRDVIGFDRNFIAIEPENLGAFQIDADGNGVIAWNDDDASLSPENNSFTNLFNHAVRSIVKTDGLNLRETPNGKILRSLTIGTPILELGEPDAKGWCSAIVGNQSGFVHNRYVRKPERETVERLIQSTIHEWLRFEKGAASEKTDPYCQYVREMWAAIGRPYDGRSTYGNGEDVPWSAAFISWVVRQAGPEYAKFRFAEAHSEFVNNAIKARITGDTSKPFWGYAIHEVKPELGDIVQRNRGKNSFSFSHAENHASYKSHSDIVVEVRDDVIRVMGGNVSNTVSMRSIDSSGDNIQEYHLDSNGFILPGQRVISILKNRT